MGTTHKSRNNNDSSSSSGEEDGDANWKAGIDSVANGFATKSNGIASNPTNQEEEEENVNEITRKPKLYQIKAQKILEDLLDKSLEVVKSDFTPEEDANELPMVEEEDGLRLFRHAPPGITDPIDTLQQPRKRPKILPGEVVDEKSRKFRRQLQSIVVDGNDIMAAARDACQKSLARYEAKNAAAEAAAKREEERVAGLKKIRGEKWLPSIAKQMQMSKR